MVFNRNTVKLKIYYQFENNNKKTKSQEIQG